MALSTLLGFTKRSNDLYKPKARKWKTIAGFFYLYTIQNCTSYTPCLPSLIIALRLALAASLRSLAALSRFTCWRIARMIYSRFRLMFCALISTSISASSAVGIVISAMECIPENYLAVEGFVIELGKNGIELPDDSAIPGKFCGKVDNFGEIILANLLSDLDVLAQGNHSLISFFGALAERLNGHDDLPQAFGEGQNTHDLSQLDGFLTNRSTGVFDRSPRVFSLYMT